LVNKFDPSGFERAADDIKGRPPRLMSSRLKLPYGDYSHRGFVGEFRLAPVEEPSRSPALLGSDHEMGSLAYVSDSINSVEND
jgi:hypothetical protein